jgi:hypothetical protein
MGFMTATATRREVIGYRVHAQQLDQPADSVGITDPAILDLGVQDSGSDAASWALANRGGRLAGVESLQRSPEVALAWTLRGAPHYYRRSELADVQVATSPYSDTDAGKRIFDANRPLKAAGISPRQALAEIAGQMRDLVAAPRAKGDVSGALAERMSEPYLRFCRTCQAVHLYEMPFRLGALHAGLELEPGTSPPVLRRIPHWPDRTLGPAEDPDSAPASLQPIRAYLRFLGPATPAEVAAFLDAPVADVKKRWPEDATPVTVDGETLWTLAAHLGQPTDPVVRLLGPFDLLLQGRDRHRLVEDASRHKQLWPTLGRPGAVLSGTDIVGTWRPKAAGKKFSVRLEPWTQLSKAVRTAVEEQAERLAAHRGLTFAGVA